MSTPLPIRRQYAILAAIVLTILMVLQTSTVVNGALQLNINQIILFAWNYLVWAFALGWIHKLTGKYQLNPDTWRKELLPFLITFLVIALVQLLLSNLLFVLTLLFWGRFDVNHITGLFQGIFFQAYASRLIDLVVIIGILRALANYRKLSEQKLAMAELQSMLTHTRLEALKMQLNPHFLFNALHAIHSMIGYDNEKARSILIKISSLLRKILEMGEKQQVSLSEELDYLRDYLDIEQERFHDRLHIQYQISDELLPALVPSLLLQPLAENALKHGISQLEGAGHISLNISHDDQRQMLIIMENSISMAQQSKANSLGIGLSNLNKRLETLYPDQFEMVASPADDQFKVTIKIPIQYED